jgi:hypothetical protein
MLHCNTIHRYTTASYQTRVSKLVLLQHTRCARSFEDGTLPVFLHEELPQLASVACIIAISSNRHEFEDNRFLQV